MSSPSRLGRNDAVGITGSTAAPAVVRRALAPNPGSPGHLKRWANFTYPKWAARARPVAPGAGALPISNKWFRLATGLLGWLALTTTGLAQTNAPATLEALQQQLRSLVTAERFQAASWGIKIVSLDSGKTLFAENETKLFSPASNCKLYPLAMALDRLGGDYRIKTSLYATTRPDARGNLKSDLIIYGRGDPGLNTKFHGGDIFRALQPLVAALTNAGVRRISGDLVGDESFFVGAPFGSGWSWDDLNYYYGAEISALTINNNTLDVSVNAGPKVGVPAVLRLTPATDLLTVSNRLRTGPANSPRQLNFYRPLGGNVVYASGTIPLGQSNQIETVTVSRPAEFFLAFFRQALARHGVTVTGPNRVITWLDRPDAPLDPAQFVELGAIESAPLREINRWVQKPSQNLYTDLVVAHLGSLELAKARRATPPGTPPETVVGTKSSEDYGMEALTTFLAQVGISPTEYWLEEGSGLSRNNLASPAATVKLLTYMSRHPEAKSYYDALPIAGEDGTLRQRMKNSAAAGNLRAKTGTLRWANSLSGYVTTAAGEKLVFSLMLNRYVAPTTESSARAELDRLGILLAGFSGRSAP